jgi:hypothetical protein
MARKQTGRNTDGTFAPGNPGGPGRPPRATEREYLKAVIDACPPDTWAEIVARAVADAKNGDGQARAWLASYLVGKPSPNHTAPRPSRLLAQEAAGSDPVAEETAQLERDRKIADMFNF